MVNVDDLVTARQVVGVLEKLARDPQTSKDISAMGGLPLMLSVLQ